VFARQRPGWFLPILQDGQKKGKKWRKKEGLKITGIASGFPDAGDSNVRRGSVQGEQIFIQTICRIGKGKTAKRNREGDTYQNCQGEDDPGGRRQGWRGGGSSRIRR